MTECMYLGHIVGNIVMKPQEGKLRAIEQFKQPKSKKQIWSFLGLIRYYYWFIPNYVTIAVPSTNKTRKAEPVVI